MRLIRRKALQATSSALVTFRESGADLDRPLVPPSINDAFYQSQTAGYAWIYRQQPAVRTVVEFLARNVSQIGLKLYQRDGDEKNEVRDHPAAKLIRSPNNFTTGEELVYNMVADYAVFDNAYLWKVRADTGQMALLRVPPHAIGVTGGSMTPKGYEIRFADGRKQSVPVEDVVHWRGYNPTDPRIGISKLETLRRILQEEAVAQASRTEMLKNGLQVPGYIERPLEAPEWSETGMKRFLEGWKARLKQNETPVLEEGMKFAKMGLTSEEAEFLEGRRFTLEVVARLYGIPLALLNLAENDYSEQRKMLYADLLAPITVELATVLDLQLIQREFTSIGNDSLYFVFNLDEKLRGDPIERMKILVNAGGRPFLDLDEQRALAGFDPARPDQDFVVPLNVTLGGKPSVGAMPPQNPNGPLQDGSFRRQSVEGPGKAVVRRTRMQERRDRYAQEHEEVLRKFFARQRRTLSSAKAKSFDADRWDRELAEDLLPLARRTVETEGEIAASRFASDFDLGQVKHYLESGALARAGAVNQVTQNKVEQAKRQNGKAAAELESVFDEAEGPRAKELGAAFATSLVSFALQEAAKQSPDHENRVKTWIVTSGAKSRHPELNGVSVPLFHRFPNGGQYPGDHALPTDETAGCQCLLDVI